MLSKFSPADAQELLEPYLVMPDFNAERAKVVSGAAESICKWAIAMASYHKASLVAGPKLEQLQIKVFAGFWTKPFPSPRPPK